MSVLKNKNSVYIFYLTVAIIGWVTSLYAKHIVKKISPKALVLFDLTMSFLFITSLVLFTNNGKQSVVSELRGLTNAEWLGLAGLGLFGTTVRVFSSSLLQYHAVETMRIAGFMISMAVSGAAVYVIAMDKFTMYKALGLLLMSIGGYMFMP